MLPAPTIANLLFFPTGWPSVAHAMRNDPTFYFTGQAACDLILASPRIRTG